MTVDLEKLTQGERQELLSALMKQIVGAVPIDLPPYDWCIPMESRTLFPGESDTLSVVAQIDWQIQRLFIVENVDQVLDRVEVIPEVVYTVEQRWWGKKRVAHSIERQVRHYRTEKVSRTNWEVQSLLVGNRMLLPNYKSIPGEMFGSNSEISLASAVCHAALFFSVGVKNRGSAPAKFSAVALGNRVKEAKPRSIVGEMTRGGK